MSMETNCKCISDLAKSRCKHYQSRTCHAPDERKLTREKKAQMVFQMSCAYFEMDITIRKRNVEMVFPRMYTAYYCLKNLGLTYQEIGELLKRERTTIIHYERTMENEFCTDKKVVESYNAYVSFLVNGMHENYSKMLGMIQAVNPEDKPENVMRQVIEISKLAEVLNVQMRAS
jgi:hypothetical protein